MKKATLTARVADDGNLAPVDRVAFRVMRPGVHWEPKVKITCKHRDTPFRVLAEAPEASPVKIGHRFGRFTVAGYIGPNDKKGAKWSVRCACGSYEVRYSRAIRNPNNADDCCTKCRHLLFLQRRDRSSA